MGCGWWEWLGGCGVGGSGGDERHMRTPPNSRTHSPPNYPQENKNSMEAKVATEHSMLRHEFLEAVIRLGVNKYGKGQQTTEVVEAVETILENNLLALVPEAAKLEANHFR